MNHIGKAHLPLSFGLADVVQSVSSRHSSLKASNSATDVVYTLFSKCCTPFCLQQWSGCHPASNPLRFFT